MKRIIRLTESDLARIVRRVIKEDAASGQIKIPAEAKFTGAWGLRPLNANYLDLTAMVGGNANKLAGNPNVVEFDARLAYASMKQSSAYMEPNSTDGEIATKNAGKSFNVKAYFGCKTGKITAKNPSTGEVQEFSYNSVDPSYEFKQWATDNVC